ASTRVESALAPLFPIHHPNRENQIRLLAGSALTRMEILAQNNSYDPFPQRKAAWDESWKFNHLTTMLASKSTIKLTIKATINSALLYGMVNILGNSGTPGARELPPELDSRDRPHRLLLSELPLATQRLFHAGLIGHDWGDLDECSN
ncbi:hypothetical protein FRC11_013625, partial [Ceratobasidium sp. 423]